MTVAIRVARRAESALRALPQRIFETLALPHTANNLRQTSHKHAAGPNQFCPSHRQLRPLDTIRLHNAIVATFCLRQLFAFILIH